MVAKLREWSVWRTPLEPPFREHIAKEIIDHSGQLNTAGLLGFCLVESVKGNNPTRMSKFLFRCCLFLYLIRIIFLPSPSAVHVVSLVSVLEYAVQERPGCSSGTCNCIAHADQSLRQSITRV